MSEAKIAQADFGGGCFWNVEEIFRTTPGVTKTEVGYEGGHVDHPTYEQVITHTTGHAETVQVSYDSSKVSYEQLLTIFFEHHDPTQLNRQGPDVGDNYRSVIFYHDESQKKEAEAYIEKIQPNLKKSIVTQVVQAAKFWGGEDYHQQYLHKRNLGICY